MLEKTFTLFGLPDMIRTDNGPPFQSSDFKEYLTRLGIRHHRVTPQWPQANGEAERFMRTLNKILCIAVAEQSDPESVLQNFL